MKTYVVFAFAAAVGITAISMVLLERRRHDRALVEIRADMAKQANPNNDARAWIPLIRQLSMQKSLSSASRVEEVEPSPTPIASTPKAPAPEAAEIRERYDDTFAQEPLDAPWADAVKRSTSEKLPSYLPEGSVVRSFECRSSMCRVVLDHKDRQNYWQFVKVAFMDSAGKFWNGPVFSVPLSDDPDDGSMLAYLVREGRALPTISQ